MVDIQEVILLIAPPGCNADFWAAIAEYRDDLLIINADRRLKLRPDVIEGIALQGTANWRIPARPEQFGSERVKSQSRHFDREASMGCYCNLPESDILSDLKVGSVPDEALRLSLSQLFKGV